MTSPLPPRRRDSRNLADLFRQDRTRLGQVDRGLVGGRFPPARPLKPATADGDDFEDDFEADQVLFSNTDTGTCTANGATITIPLSHVPEDGSEQVYYGRTPLRRTEWTRTDTVLTIPGEPWFRAGRVAWVDYAYYDQEADVEFPTVVGVTSVVSDHTTIPIPDGTIAGDMLVLVISARATGAPSDSRFPDPGFTDTMGGFGVGGVWVGTASGAGTPVTINMTSGGIGDAADGVAALMAIRGTPLTITANQTSVTSSSGTNPFTPAVPSASAGFGIAALFAVTGLVPASINEQTAYWTPRFSGRGDGAGKCAVYLGTCDNGVPIGTWATAGSTIIGGARIMGVQ